MTSEPRPGGWGRAYRLSPAGRYAALAEARAQGLIAIEGEPAVEILVRVIALPSSPRKRAWSFIPAA